MRLRLKNFAKIHTADVQLNGLTIICGLNNTGKSTVGKALHVLINSLAGIDGKVKKQRRDLIDKALFLSRGAWGRADDIRTRMDQRSSFCSEIRSKIQKHHSDSKEQLAEWISACLKQNNAKSDALPIIAVEIASALWRVLNLPEESARKIYVDSAFKKMFGEPIVSVYDSSLNASVELEYKGDTFSVEFDESSCVSLKDPGTILHRSLFVDDPSVVDGLSDDRVFKYGRVFPTVYEIVERLSKYKGIKQNPDNAFERALVSDTLSQMTMELSQMMEGRIVVGSKGVVFQLKRGGAQLDLQNLSQGVKSCALLYMLLDALLLRENEILVLDEPEIHLHTEWQVKYAEMIVLIQKYFHLTVVVTTHSPYFLDALEQFARKYETIQCANFYLSHAENGWSDIEDVTGHLNKVYDVITPSLEVLATLRHENDNPEK